MAAHMWGSLGYPDLYSLGESLKSHGQVTVLPAFVQADAVEIIEKANLEPKPKDVRCLFEGTKPVMHES